MTTEQNLGASEPSAEVQAESPAPQAEQTVAEGQEVPQKMKGYVPDQEVNDLVKGAKEEGYKKAQRELEARQQAEALMQVPQAQAESPPTDANKGPMTEEEVRRLIDQEAERRVNQQRAQEVASSFIGKMQQGMSKYSDFEAVVTDLNIPQLPGQMITLVNSMDNTADVMYELGKNPEKFANVLALSVTSPGLAQKAMTKLSSSIKQNQEAVQKNSASVQEPLDQVKPSTTGTDSGSMSISDLRKQDWLR